MTNYSCNRGYSVSFDSYIDYECKKAVKDELKIVVLYKATSVDKSKCPDLIKNIGTHASMVLLKGGSYYWDYETVKNAINS